MRLEKVSVLLRVGDRRSDHRMVQLNLVAACHPSSNPHFERQRQKLRFEIWIWCCDFAVDVQYLDGGYQFCVDSRREKGEKNLIKLVTTVLKLFCFQRNAFYIKIAFTFFLISWILSLISVAGVHNWSMITLLIVIPYILLTLYSLNAKFAFNSTVGNPQFQA